MSKSIRFTVTLILIFLVVVASNLIFRDPNTYPIIRLVPFLGSIGLGIAAAIYAAKAYGFGSEHGKALLILAMGMVFTLAGDLIFDVVFILQQSIPFPSIADFLYILGYLFFLIGLIKEVLIYKTSISSIDAKAKLGIFVFLLFIGSIILYLEVFLQVDPSGAILTNIAKISLGIIDLFLLGLVSVILKTSLDFGEGKFFRPWLAIFFAVVSSMIGNLVFSLYTEQYLTVVWPYTMLNIFWVISYLLVTYGLIRIGSLIHEAQNMFQK